MKYNFDEIIERKGTNSVKWEAGEILKQAGYTERYDNDTIPLFVADMDFAIPQPVLNALHKRVNQRMFGYTLHTSDDEYNYAIQNWFKRRFNWSIKKEEIVYSPGTVHALNIAILAYTKPGDGVLIQRPVYPPFTKVIEKNQRQVINNELVNHEGYYSIDFEDLEDKAQKPDTTMMILCSPHNPVGRIWQKWELEKIAEICKKNNIILVSDEIHGDLIRCEQSFYPIATVTDMNNLVVCTAINKTFNVAGLHCSNIVISNEILRKKFSETQGIQSPSPFVISALIAAYNEGEEWLEQLKEYVDSNFDFLKKFLTTQLPKVKYRPPEGTYIAWLDFSSYKLTPEEVHKRIYLDANVVLQDGKMFGEYSSDFQRICLPTPKSILKEALERIARQF